MGLRQDKRSRDRQGAVSPPQESGPATSLRPTQGDQNPRVFDRAGLKPTEFRGFPCKPDAQACK